MTYAEAIKKSLDKFTVYGFKDDGHGSKVQDSEQQSEMYPICFSSLVQGLAGLQIHLAQTLLMQDFPDVNVGGVDFEGKASDVPNILAIQQLLMGYMTLTPRGMAFIANWGKFVNWLLDCPIPENEIIWYDQDTLIEKWNEFAKEDA